jgi:uncharacterized protein YbjQ (UPF0145 family)
VARMSAECAALGGDGVVAVRAGLSPCPWDGRAVAFTAYGVAVRARGNVRAPAPFTAHLSGPDFARLILNGWVPAGIAIGAGEMWRNSAATEASPAHRMREIGPWSDALTAAREDGRRRLLDDAQLIGGDGLLLATAETRVHLGKAARQRLHRGGHLRRHHMAHVVSPHQVHQSACDQLQDARDEPPWGLADRELVTGT